MVASQEKRRQKEVTRENWTKVRVAGFGKTFRMALEEVFVRALEVYHIIQRIISKGETGAFNASPISCTFVLTLPLLVRIVLKASLKLFCLPCLPPVLADPFVHDDPDPFKLLSLLGCHLSADTGLAV